MSDVLLEYEDGIEQQLRAYCESQDKDFDAMCREAGRCLEGKPNPITRLTDEQIDMLVEDDMRAFDVQI